MGTGIRVCGIGGCGKRTIGRTLATETGFAVPFDAESKQIPEFVKLLRREGFFYYWRKYG